MSTLYDELGARPDASAEELRQAYRRRARQLHPDLRPDDGAAADEAMSRLNAAWRVLSDPDERRRYDLELALEAARIRAEQRVSEGRVGATAAGGRDGARTVDGDDLDLVGRDTVHFRPRAWMVVVAVLAVIFVFTAYAAGRPVSKREPGTPGECIAVIGGERYVPCSEPNIGRLVAEVGPDEPCPAGSFRHQIPDAEDVACLTRS